MTTFSPNNFLFPIKDLLKEKKITILTFGCVWEDNIKNKYLQKGISSLYNFNGGGVIIISDFPHLHILTDTMGFFPVFLFQPQNITEAIVSSSSLSIYNYLKLNNTFLNIDFTSVQESILYNRLTPPFTFIENIHFAGAASHHYWNLNYNKYTSSSFWKLPSLFKSKKEAVVDLTHALLSSINLRTNQSSIVFLSGGLDSRLIPYASKNKESLSCLNLFDSPNLESKIAQDICKDSFTSYTGLKRKEDYYPSLLNNAPLTEGLCSIYDCHFIHPDVLNLISSYNVLSMEAADTMFKYVNIVRKDAKFFNFNLPWFLLSDLDGPFFTDPDISPCINPSLIQRQLAYFDKPTTHNKLELQLFYRDKRSRPLCYTGLPLIANYKLFNFDSPLADSLVTNCYSRLPLEWQLNSDIWKSVVINICGNSIPNSNTSLSINASKLQLLFQKLINKFNKLSSISSNLISTSGSWPNYSWYILNSPLLFSFYSNISKNEKELILSLSPYSLHKPLSDWIGKERTLFRILSTLSVLRYLQF